MIELSNILSWVALIASLWALREAQRSQKRSEDVGALLAHQSDIVETEARLGSLPKALRFHGLSLTDLQEVGLEPEEFAYLLNSFTLGGVWQRVIGKGNTGPYQGGSYRYVMCKSRDTRKAWPLVR